jgi:hypothetical protein
MGAWGWQGRYLLPVAAAVCVFAVPGLVDGLERWTASRRLLPWMLVVLMGVNALSVPWFLFRNVYGFKVWLAGLSAAPLPIGVRWWSPPLGQGAVLAFTTVAFACGVGAVWALPDVPAKTRPGSLQPAAHGSVAGGPTIDVPPAQ